MSDSPWPALRRYTQARIGLGRAGSATPTKAILEFGLAHAQARDAVHAALSVEDLQQQLSAASFQSIAVHSAAADRPVYLRRPDLGRRLVSGSRQSLQDAAVGRRTQLALIVADGLSALAVHRHALAMLQALRTTFGSGFPDTIVIASQARVALGDEIGEVLQASQTLLLIGERPGLSAADSLGIYLTHAPRVGRTDAERNCISNIRQGGLSYEEAARRAAALLNGAMRLGASGVRLKDDSERAIASPAGDRSR
jgi:ethanolamine ammonia-lyase small subunit